MDENERMYTWGSSPQALRLANQIKRRANAKQKNEEHQRREMSRRFEATLSESGAATEDDVPTTSAAIRETKLDEPSEIVTVTAFDSADVGDKLCDAVVSGVKDEILDLSDKAEAAKDCDIQIIVEDLVSDMPLVSTKEKCETDTAPVAAAISSSIPVAASSQQIVEVDPCEHMSPHLVDTSEVAGQILQVRHLHDCIYKVAQK